MTQGELIQLRLINQHLVGEKFQNPHEAVSYFGGVQSQDYFGAAWSLGQRVQGATASTINEAFNEGKILRTHIMRPTWHFVTPEDIRWMQELTASQVKKLIGHYNRKLDLDDTLFAKTEKIIVNLLEDQQYATRQEIKAELTKAGIHTDVQRLGHIVSWAELDAVICSGPRIGKQFTYALVEKRVKKHRKLNREESLAELTKRYFTSHGPAQLRDFVWWSGLSVTTAREGLEMVKSKLHEATIDDKTYWFINQNKPNKQASPTAFALSIYDEYTIAYNDRTALGGKMPIEKLLAMGNALTAVILIDGKVVGTWKRALKKNTVEIKQNLFIKLTPKEQQALDKTLEDYGKFLGLSVQ